MKLATRRLCDGLVGDYHIRYAVASDGSLIMENEMCRIRRSYLQHCVRIRVGHVVRGEMERVPSDHQTWGGELQLLTIRGAQAVGCVGSHVVRLPRRKPFNEAVETARSAAINRMAIGNGGGGLRTPADTPGGHGFTPVGEHIASRGNRGRSNVRQNLGGDRGKYSRHPLGVENRVAVSWNLRRGLAYRG